jgi:hypothetical protein
MAGTMCTITSPTVKVHPLVHRDKLCPAGNGDVPRIEGVIVVRVRDEYGRRLCRSRVAAHVLEGIRRGRIAAQERIDENARTAGRDDLERRMTKPPDGDRPVRLCTRGGNERGEQCRGDEGAPDERRDLVHGSSPLNGGGSV